MILDIDAGNTQLKWRLTDANEPMVHRVGGELITCLQEITNQIASQQITRVRVAHVLSKASEFVINQWAQRWHVKVEFARTTQSCAGVTNAYQQPERLGVDRWLAVLAAFAQIKAACCVIDCGSAITVDVINEKGEHQGGLIVPGLSLMAKSLHDYTAKLPLIDCTQGKSQWGVDTDSAIANGVVMAQLGLVEKVIQSAAKTSAQYTVVLTGGDAPILAKELVVDSRVVIIMSPDLVLDGLAIALP